MFTKRKDRGRTDHHARVRDLELIKPLLKDRDGYIKSTVADCEGYVL